MVKGGLNAEKDSKLKKSIEAQEEEDELPSYGATVRDEAKMSSASASNLSQCELGSPASSVHSNDVDATTPSINQPPRDPVSSAPSALIGVEENYVPPSMPLPIVKQPIGRDQISQQPIIQQAGFPSSNSILGLQWMPVPSPNNVPGDCLIGLERLEHVDQIILQHRTDPEELLSLNFHVKYEVKNSAEQLVLFSMQDRVIPAPMYETLQCMEFGLYDENQNRVAHVSRTQVGSYICGSQQPKFTYRVDVSCPPSNRIASVVKASSFGPKFDVMGPDGNFLLRIKGLSSNCCSDPLAMGITYEIESFGEKLGNVSKRLPGHGEYASPSEIYFSRYLPAKIKLMIIGFIMTQDRLFAVKYPYSRTGPVLLPPNTVANRMQQNPMLQALNTGATNVPADYRAHDRPTYGRARISLN